MMKSGFLFLFIILSLSLFPQSAFRELRKLSSPEKCWVLFHPFVAKKAFVITKQVLLVVDSLKRTDIIGTDMNGGKLDAFRHAYWMGALTNKIGKKKSLKLGKAHEKGNFIQFKKHQLEDAILPDSVSCCMDLMNNNTGAGLIGGKLAVKEKREIQNIIINAIKSGQLKIIKKDKNGNYLLCDGTFIDMNEWKGKWNIPKCLITSDQN